MDPFVRANGMGGAESRVRQRLDAHNRAFCKPLQQDAVRRVSLESIEKTRLGECLLTILFVEAAQAPSRFVCKQIAVRVIFERLREARRVELTQNVITNLCRPATGRQAQEANSRPELGCNTHRLPSTTRILRIRDCIGPVSHTSARSKFRHC